MSSAPSPGFRRLAGATVAATFFLIVLGGLVRVSDSGLGCGPAGSGLAGWPLCRGDVIPTLELQTVIEYAHRATASAVAVLMLALALWAWRAHRSQRGLVRATLVASGLVIAQGLLGALTVELNLDALLVALHLGLAMLLLALVIYVWRASRPDVIGAPPTGGGALLRRLATASAATILLTIVAGGYMAGTERNGRTDEATAAGAHYACGTDFPLCNGSLLPFGQTTLADVHLTHRALMYLASALVVALAVVALRRRPDRAVVRSALGALALLIAQVLVGAANVWVPTESEPLILVHLTLATLLWAQLIELRLRLSPVPSPPPPAQPAERREALVA